MGWPGSPNPRLPDLMEELKGERPIPQDDILDVDRLRPYPGPVLGGPRFDLNGPVFPQDRAGHNPRVGVRAGGGRSCVGVGDGAVCAGSAGQHEAGEER